MGWFSFGGGGSFGWKSSDQFDWGDSADSALSAGGSIGGDSDYFTILLEWMFRRRPLVATACCVAVSVDQVFWYVDLAVYFIR